MKHRVTLAGVHGMALEAGQLVRFTPAYNLPEANREGYFAAPADGRWSDGVERNPEDSILLDWDDFEQVTEQPLAA